MRMSRQDYAQLYGPTAGDAVRLGDTSLIAEIELDHAVPGDECLHGGGKTLRDGMGLVAGLDSAMGSLDMVISNAVVIDPVLGIVKGDIGVKDGRIVGVGKAGNPAIMDGVDPALVCGAATTARDAEGLIATPGGIDVHVHFDSAQHCEHAIASGITTMLGGSLGPITVGIDCGGAWNVGRMLQAAEAWPINFGFLGRGNSSKPRSLVHQIEGGCLGLKIHEDWGAMPAAIDCCLGVADELDFQVQLHTDTLNESGFLEDTLAAIRGRTIHMYHTEGAGGGHAPDIIRVAGEINCLPSSTNPTNPYTVNTFDEHLDMIMVCHHLSARIPEDLAFAESRIRAETIAAEDVLHDLGAISMMSSDSQAMGRIGEVIIRTWQTADKMKRQRGPLPGETSGDDNLRVKRYVAKYTINPAIAHGLSSHVGSVEVGKLADLVLWKPAFFGVKPEMVVKGGLIARAAMGDPNASIPTPQPVLYRPMFGALGRAVGSTALTFVSAAALADGVPQRLGLTRRAVAVSRCRGLGKRDMIHNDALPRIEVDPETYQVRADGTLLTCEPARVLPMAQRYFLF